MFAGFTQDLARKTDRGRTAFGDASANGDGFIQDLLHRANPGSDPERTRLNAGQDSAGENEIGRDGSTGERDQALRAPLSGNDADPRFR